jgi:hypothetical protein
MISLLKPEGDSGYLSSSQEVIIIIALAWRLRGFTQYNPKKLLEAVCAV